MFTADEMALIRAVLSNPAELTTWLVYADWLEEHGKTNRSEFLRLMVRRGQLNNTELEWYSVEERIQALRATLNQNWVAVFDRPRIENCDAAFRFTCPKKWENLKVLNESDVRYCTLCEKRVYYCHTLEEAQSHARQEHCVAVQLGVLRYPGDLRPPIREEGSMEDLDCVLGMFDAEAFSATPEPRRPWWKFW